MTMSISTAASQQAQNTSTLWVRSRNKVVLKVPFCQTYLEKTDIIITNLSKGLMCNLRHSSASHIIMDGLGRPAGPASASQS
ncbi:unnamed protein product [Coccothraustes coccothraustes]